ncbi:MAG: hypothetical protein JRN16_09095, partial [Nitrososphaerota archaeon]|nr:hypothetical protein [Nitrososphaerota archaeon]
PPKWACEVPVFPTSVFGDGEVRGGAAVAKPANMKSSEYAKPLTIAEGEVPEPEFIAQATSVIVPVVAAPLIANATIVPSSLPRSGPVALSVTVAPLVPGTVAVS